MTGWCQADSRPAIMKAMLPSRPDAALRIALEFVRKENAGDPYGFRFSTQEYLCRSAEGEYESAPLAWDATLLCDLADLQRRPFDPAIMPRLGERLRTFVNPLGWSEHATQVLEAVGNKRRVLITIRSAAAELYALPWELLTLKSTGQHVGELDGVLFRYEWPRTATKPELPAPRQGSGRILLAWSAAGGPVPAGAHCSAIANARRAVGLHLELDQDVLPHLSCGRLTAALAAADKRGQPISVLHILCHGGTAGSTFGLVLDSDSPAAESVVVDAGRLRQLLSPYAGMVRLVVLLACNSGNPGVLGNQLGSIAQALHRAGIAAIVASRYPMSVAGSIRLAETLYPRLLFGLESLESALLAVRATVAEHAESLDWAGLQLYARAADGDDTRPVVFRPYQGLNSYRLLQRRFFFGRETLTRQLWERLRTLHESPGAPRLLAIIGPSGSGKSSVACAGLLAELERDPLPSFQPLRIVVLQPGPQPLYALAHALDRLPATPAGSLPLLVLVDQFEEIYTLCQDGSERSAFVECLLSAAQNPSWCVTVVLTLRSDFLGETLRHHLELNRIIASQCTVIGGMSPEELRQAVVGPASRVGRPLDEGLVDLLLSQAAGNEGALPLLSFTLARLWEGVLADKPPSLTLSELGGVGGALAGEASRIFSQLDAAGQATARRALVRLVKLGEGVRDTRRRMRVRELCGRNDSEAAVLAVLRQFASEQARLITLSGGSDAPVAEFTHEALFHHWQQLRTWIDEGRADRRFHDRAAEAARLWDEAQRPSGRLWRPPDLDLLRDYHARHTDDLSPLESEFLQAAIMQQEAERREKEAVQQHLREAYEEARQQLLETYVEQGRQLLVEKDQPSEALLWLHRAYEQGCKAPMLPYLLADALQYPSSVRTTLVGHGKKVTDASFSADGRYIVTASEDGTARVWTDSGQLCALLSGHRGALGSASFSPDDRRIVTSSMDHTARVWTVHGFQLLAELVGHSDSLWSAEFSPDGRFIVTASMDRTARLWKASSGQLLATLAGHRDAVTSARFSPDGQHVLTSSMDKTARLWSVDSGQGLIVLSGHSLGVKSSSFSPDGQHIVTASMDKTACVWSAASGKLVYTLSGHFDAVISARFSPDGRRIVTASMDKTARLWKAHNGHFVAELKGHNESLRSTRFSPDGRWIVTTSGDSTARVWEAERGRLWVALKGHRGAVGRANFSADSHSIITSSGDHSARVWKIDGGCLQSELVGHLAIIGSACFSPDGSSLATASSDCTARLWAVDSGQLLAILQPHHSVVRTVEFSRDGQRIVTASEDGIARVWTVPSGQLQLELTGHRDKVRSARFSPDGQMVLTASEDNSLRLWAASTGVLVMELGGHSAPLTAVGFSPDGQRILSASRDRTARIWRTDSGEMLAILAAQEHSVWSACFSPDGTRVATASLDHRARIWDARSGELLAELTGHRDPVWSVGFSSDGSRIVTASSDQTARVWDAQTGLLLAELTGHSDSLWSASFSPDGLRIVTASSDHTARIWEAESGRLLVELRGHSKRVRFAGFSPDGRRVVTTSADGIARLWNVAPASVGATEIASLIASRLACKFASARSNAIVPTALGSSRQLTHVSL